MPKVREEDIDRITEVFYLILKGKIPTPLELPEDYPDNEVKQAVTYLNQFLVEYQAVSPKFFPPFHGANSNSTRPRAG